MNEKMEQIYSDLSRLTDSIYVATGEWIDFTPVLVDDEPPMVEVTSADEHRIGFKEVVPSVDAAYRWADEFIERVRS